MDDRFPASVKGRRGFTLVEMLVVIAIIGILAGLVTMAGVSAIGQAKRTTIRMEISQLEIALNAYKEKYGDYPPDFADIGTDQGKATVLRHLRLAFPKYIPGLPSNSSATTPWARLLDDIKAAYDPDLPFNLEEDMTAAQAMAFWLGGMPAVDPTDHAVHFKRLDGFSADPKNPFRVGGSRTDPLFEFDETRLINYDEVNQTWSRWPAYKSEHVKSNAPYVYFRPRVCEEDGGLEYGCVDDVWLLSCGVGNAGICVPYCTNGPEDWNKPKSFQIISPGMDGLFGAMPAPTFRFSATGANFTEGDYDNITNFSSTTLEDGLE